MAVDFLWLRMIFVNKMQATGQMVTELRINGQKKGRTSQILFSTVKRFYRLTLKNISQTWGLLSVKTAFFALSTLKSNINFFRFAIFNKYS
ncbi:hypothetical protein DR864_12400 [Runella rosea]|uniref:Uncharacterized protein n=1 Tax=Runella rosea TaxID=2259595 RepID=A0A344TIM6_9BACT|nr:hypothetical protein DR864_12400 [Runella rosea]